MRAFHVSPVPLRVGDEIVPANEAGHYCFERLYEDCGLNGDDESRADFIYLTMTEQTAWDSGYGHPTRALNIPLEDQVRRVYKVEIIGEWGTAEMMAVPFPNWTSPTFDEYDRYVADFDFDGEENFDPPELEYPPCDSFELVARRARVIRVIDSPVSELSECTKVSLCLPEPSPAFESVQEPVTSTTPVEVGS